MNHIEVTFSIAPRSEVIEDILVAHLADIGFNSFADGQSGPLAYIPKAYFNQQLLEEVSQQINSLGSKIHYSFTEIEEVNWNKEWEANFNPITIEDFCRVRAPFHEPDRNFRFEIVIEPKMSFGTGHHQTTWLMARELFNLNLQGKRVLDMGCGTGILAIIAKKLGAADVTAIDNDEWAFRNAIENVTLNECSSIKVELGDAQLLDNRIYDVIVANINLNILLVDIDIYAKCLSTDGVMLLSGILNTDISSIRKKVDSTGLQFIESKSLNDWALVACRKQ
jgi:ribosomal protein L11 methyltransferase